MLKSLVGPEFREISIKNPEKVHFKPNELLDDLTFIYTNLSCIESFCKSVVKDERSFKLEYLNLAYRKLKVNKKHENLADLDKFIQLLS